MKPETIPWLLCGAVCILPFLIGLGAFYGMRLFTNRYPVREISRYNDSNGRQVVRTEWSMLAREDKHVHDQPEGKE
jgi:hypothetical protein